MTAQARPTTNPDDSLATLDEPVRLLLAAIPALTAAGSPDLAAIGAALVRLAGESDYLARWVERLGDVNGSLAIHAPARGPRLSIVHRREGQMGAVHDHGTWVALAPIVGLETHRRYRVVGAGTSARPEVAETHEVAPKASVTLLPPDDLHDHGHVTGRGSPAYVLILTGDDQAQFTRNEWDVATGRHRLLLPGDRGRWLASDPMPATDSGG
jgi:predicted metal-dependent enzyme (double-stranded beta helix superfamily)